MRIENQIRAFAGAFILLSLVLWRFNSHYWLFFTAFVGVNLLQSAFTCFCPLETILRKLQARAPQFTRRTEMTAINFKTDTQGDVEQVVARVTEALQREGFGVLTRIDLHSKIKEKLGKDLAPAVILGACNPGLAYEAYCANPDVASLLPCNAVIRELAPGRVSVELAKPTAMMEMLGDKKLVQLAQTADQKLQRVLDAVKTR